MIFVLRPRLKCDVRALFVGTLVVVVRTISFQVFIVLEPDLKEFSATDTDIGLTWLFGKTPVRLLDVMSQPMMCRLDGSLHKGPFTMGALNWRIAMFAGMVGL